MASGSEPGRPERYSDPMSPHAGINAFPALRNPTLARARSASPRKRYANQPVQIRMNLTENQMNKITHAFTQRLHSNSPKVTEKGVEGPGQTPMEPGDFLPKTGSSRGIPNTDRNDDKLRTGPSSNSTSTTRDEFAVSALAERRQKTSLSLLNLPKGPLNHHPTLTRPRRETVPDCVSPLSPVSQRCRRTNIGRASSRYSSEYSPSPDGRIQPLKLKTSKVQTKTSDHTDSLYQNHDHWAQVAVSGIDPVCEPPKKTCVPERVRYNENKLLNKDDFQASPEAYQPIWPLDSVAESPLFSPLAFYFRGQNLPVMKRGQKTLIGDNGWLEKTGHTMAPAGSKVASKRTGIFDSIRKIARDMADIHHPHRRHAISTRIVSTPQITISLDVREQSLLYCELEYHLTSALNDYIARELEKGHLLPDNLKKISDAWNVQGRPRVIGFRFDLETQIDLVALHINEFTFHGRRQAQPAEISGLLQSMKANACAIRIRTFCQADSVIAKQLIDSQALFDTIGVLEISKNALTEIVQFFKAIVEREQECYPKEYEA